MSLALNGEDSEGDFINKEREAILSRGDCVYWSDCEFDLKNGWLNG